MGDEVFAVPIDKTATPQEKNAGGGIDSPRPTMIGAPATGQPAWQNRDNTYVKEADFPPRMKLLRWLGRQTWIQRGHDRILRAIWSPDSSESFFFDIEYYGVRYRGNLGHYIDWLVFCYGGAPTSELFLLDYIVNVLRMEGALQIHFADVGGNAGGHTLFMARLVNQIYVFEPLDRLCALIRSRLAYNNISNAFVFEIALGHSDGTLPYYPSETNNSGTGTLLPDREEARSQPIQVTVKNGDRFFDTQNLPRIDIMKVDVEGYEHQVFEGLSHRLAKDRPIVLTEISQTSRAGFKTENGFKECLYSNAVCFGVEGRNGKSFTLTKFDFNYSSEVLVVPKELGRHFTRLL